MDILYLFAAFVTIVAGIIAALQLWDRIKKQKQKQKRKTTFLLSKESISGKKESIILINFTHPLTKKNLSQIQQLIDFPIKEVIEVKTQLDEDAPFDKQIDDLVDQVGFSSEQWQTGKLLVHLPGFAPAAAALLAELHGRIGHFPAILRLRSVAGTTPREFELAEIINLQSTRDAAREKR